MKPADRIAVLHVEDDPDFAAVAAEFLERADDRLDVETVGGAAAGSAYLAEHDVDCVVSDYELPERDGLRFLADVRELRPDLPFVLFTGKGSETVASEAISAGVTDYLQKETGTDQFAILANRIRNAVERDRARRDRHLAAIESAREGIGILDEDGRLRYVNRACADLFGYDRAELVGEHWGVIYPDDEARRIREEVLPVVREVGRWHGTSIGLRADGTTFLEEHVLTTTADGGLVCTVQATDRPALRQKFELVARASTDAFWDWNPATDEITRSEEYLAGFGYDAADVRSDTDWWRERIHPDDRDRVLAALERAVERPEASYDETYRFRTKDGDYGDVRSRGYVVYDDRGDPERMVGAHIDITERKERERALEQQNERLDEFASVVSHDLRNPLNVAEGYLELARESCDDDSLDTVADAHDRMRALIDDLLTLAREGETVAETAAVDVAAAVGRCWDAIRARDATLDVRTDRTIEADEGRFRQLVENLLRNAVEHGEDDVTVTVGALDDEAGLYVADDGPGIPPGDRDEAFEAGFSTGESGTGFGLTIVQEIADAHGWSIAATAARDGGARFEIADVEFVDE